MTSNPAAFQGVGRRAPYFEGWYYKLQTAQGRTVALIPGLSLSGRHPHSFVQVVDERRGSWYVEYPAAAFSACSGRLDVTVGHSRFGSCFVRPDIPDDPRVHGCVEFIDPVPFPRSASCPGIMGPFSFLPTNECRHDVILLRCGLKGSLMLQGEVICFDGGRGYLEKDWGRAFPSGYLWAQGCGFEAGTSFMLAVARVPMAGLTFTGIIGCLYDGTRLYKIATYTGARLLGLRRQGEATEITVGSPGLRLTLRAWQQGALTLRAPLQTGMSRTVKESVSATLEVTLRSARGRLLFSGRETFGSFETGGELPEK